MANCVIRTVWYYHAKQLYLPLDEKKEALNEKINQEFDIEKITYPAPATLG